MVANVWRIIDLLWEIDPLVINLFQIQKNVYHKFLLSHYSLLLNFPHKNMKCRGYIDCLTYSLAN